MSFGLALSGGGAKGAAHVGVLLALAEENLIPTSIAGTSSGSIVAGLYSVGIKPPEMKKIIYNLSKNGINLLDPSYKEIIDQSTEGFIFEDEAEDITYLLNDGFDSYDESGY